MAAGVMAVDATCMALLAISASRWDGTAAAARVDSAVMLLQLLALCGEWDADTLGREEGMQSLEGHREPKACFVHHSRCYVLPKIWEIACRHEMFRSAVKRHRALEPIVDATL